MNPLLDRLVDDAGLFPPTALAPADAVRRHRADLATAHPLHSHRFLVAAGRLAEIRAELLPGDRFAVGLIADGTPADSPSHTPGSSDPAARLAVALAVVDADPRLALALVEAPVALFASDPATAVRTVLSTLGPCPAPLFLEPPRPAEVDTLLAALPRDEKRVTGVKLRCGGVRAELFPDTADTARFIVACARAGVPFKATAGLHRAVRHRDPATGFTHHGYLNLLLATATACRTPDPDPDQVRAVLDLTNPAELADRTRQLSPGDIGRTRELLVSYGSCSTGTPVTEAAAVLALTRKVST